MNDTDAPTNENRAEATAQQAASTSGGSAASGGTAAPKSTEPKLPSLSGKYAFIKDLCASQRPSLGKVMADSSIAMFKTYREISDRIESLARFNTTYVDKHDKDDNGKGKTKPFVPSSLRNKMPLNSSKKVKKDSRCVCPHSPR